MNRRDLFKSIMGTAAISAGGIALVESTATIFLPPRQGWWQPELRMREVQQYLINTDELAMRYDMAWAVLGGVKHYHVDCLPVGNPGWPREMVPSEIMEINRTTARRLFEDIEHQHGFKRCDQRALPLPQGVNIARYV